MSLKPLRGPEWLHRISWIGGCLMGLVWGCGAQTPKAVHEPAPHQSTRRPPGVALDPQTALPSTKSTGQSGDGLLVLEAPQDTEVVREVVRDFFRAVASESEPELERVLAPAAGFRTSEHAQRQDALRVWQARFARLDYTALTTHPYQEASLDIYAAADGSSLWQGLPWSASGHDILVHVRIAPETNGQTRLFGDDLWFLLKPDSAGFGLAEIVEDFALP